jgi:histidine triad (HIT) family protein
MSSIFTKIIQGDIPSYKIAENDEFIAFLDVFPVRKGHTLIVPKIEVDYIFGIEDQLLGRMMIFAKSVAIALEKAMPCKRIGVSVIGLEVPHAHIHLIPIQSEKDLEFSHGKMNLEPNEFVEILSKIKSFL